MSKSIESTRGPVATMLTPLARGAIATVGVRGCGAIAAVTHCFEPASGRPLASTPLGRVVYGRFRTEAPTAEELIVGLLGPDDVEVHCHGGVAAVRAVLSALVAAGCQEVDPPTWANQTNPDRIAAAALLALGQARTERTAAILLDQYRGALRTALQAIAQSVRAGDLDGARRQLATLVLRAEFGLHLTDPWRVVLSGPPNVGKSSLINALLGYQRAIVFDQPGTTRDVLTATTAFAGWPIELADTAGLRASKDEIEAAGVARAWNCVAAADLVIQVHDTTAPWSAESLPQPESFPGIPLLAARRPPLLVHNKCDLAPPPPDGRPVGLAVSARTGLGLEQLCAAIVSRLVPDPPPPKAAVPFTKQHVAWLETIGDALTHGDAARACQEINRF